MGLLGLCACKQPATPPTATTGTAQTALASDPVPPLPPGDPADEVVLVWGSHDTLSAARQGLTAALKLTMDLPLPFPRVERHGDVFRVVLARGKRGALQPLLLALFKSGQRPIVLLKGQAGGDDVIRLGIVCPEGETAALYPSPLPAAEKPKELARLPLHEVVVPREDDEALAGPGRDREADFDPGAAGKGPASDAERGYLTVLQPQPGVVFGPDVLLPADCTPRDEDNDDGNGRLLQGGRLCLTTRFSGKQGSVPHADLLAVAPSYRRCIHFPDAGTFDGFDHDAQGTQFAVEAAVPKAGAPDTKVPGLRIYAVTPRGDLQLRGQLPGLLRPAYLAEGLIAVADALDATDKTTVPSLVALDGLAKRDLATDAPLPPLRRVWGFAPASFVRFVAKVPQVRPAAPTLSDGQLHATFQQACRADGEKRVRTAAKQDFVQCVLEVEVTVGLDGKNPHQTCRLDNVQNALDEPLTVPCP
jgi:hypothetical protein